MRVHTGHHIVPDGLIRLYKTMKDKNPHRLWIKRDLREQTGLSNLTLGKLLHVLTKMELVKEVPAEYIINSNKVITAHSVKGYKLK
jgi:hypothetical protein